MLNDFCLLKVFKHLSINDLANFKEAFEDRAPIVDMEFSSMTNGSLDFGFNDNENIIETIKQFGPLVKKLSIYYDKLRRTTWEDIFSAIKDHCNENLKDLSLNGRSIRSIKEDKIPIIAKVLKNLETLELEDEEDTQHRFYKEYVEIVSYCFNIHTLTFTSIVDINQHPTLFLDNIRLSKLKWCGPKDDGSLEMIVDNLMMTELKELVISFMEMTQGNGNFSEFLRLRCLKRLSIDCKFVDIRSFLSDIDVVPNSLNLLTLSFALLDHENIETLGRTKQLNILKLCEDCVLVTNSWIAPLLTLCRNKSFEHLLIFCCGTGAAMDKKNFLEIVEARKSSGSEKCLHLALSHSVFDASVKAIPAELLEQNKSILKLIDERDNDYEYNNLDDF